MKPDSLPSRRGPVAPKPLGKGGLASSKPSSVGGFTLIEIMIVVSVVMILSLLASVAIGRIKDRAARSIIENNLRQLYQAKEYYFTDSGESNPVKVLDLSKKGFLRQSLFASFTDHGSLETKMGWRYNLVYKSGEPIYAHHYANSNGTGPISETIWYPGPPEGAVANTGSSSQPVTPPPLIPQPPVVVQQPPVVAQPPAVIVAPPVTTTTVNPSGNQAPAVTGSTAAANANPGNQPQPNQSPGNSAHGHAQGNGQGNGNGNGHGKP